MKVKALETQPLDAARPFLDSKNNNLRYIGLRILEAVIKADDSVADEYQTELLECLKSSDHNLQQLVLNCN